MARGKQWGVPDFKPEHYDLTLQGRVLTWVYIPPENTQRAKPVSPGEGEYANYSDGLKLHFRAKRQRRTFSKKLFTLNWRPRWLISCVYPYAQAHSLTPEQLRSDLDSLGNRFRDYYYNGYALYQIDYSDEARFHLHLLGRCGGGYPKPKKRGRKKLRIKHKAREWWKGRVESPERHLVKVQYLPTEMDSYAVCSYLTRGEKLENHIRVTDFMGKRHTFGCFNEKNLRVAARKRYEISPETFSEIRKVICFDVHEDSKRSGDSYLSDHESKIIHAGSGYHIINDPDLDKKIERKLVELIRQSEGGK